jgi:predicted metalloprotease
LWTADCFAGAWLTFPATQRKTHCPADKSRQKLAATLGGVLENPPAAAVTS